MRPSNALGPTEPKAIRGSAVVLALGLVTLPSACGERYAWDASSSGSAGPRVLGPRAAASSPPLEDDLPTLGPAGGVLASCAKGLVPTWEPIRDVTRLSLACGAATGMNRLGSVTHEGAIAADGVHVTIPLSMSKGSCYRVFAAATSDVGDLVVLIRSSRGTTIASDHAAGRLAMVQPDRPVCALEDDAAEVDVAAGSGHGRFALEIYEAGGAQ